MKAGPRSASRSPAATLKPTASSRVCYAAALAAWEDARTFNNDWMGYAVKNGLRLRELLGVGT